MKKIMAIVLAVALMFALCLTANAATGLNDFEKEILSTLKNQEVTGENGWKFKIPDEYITAAENYFNTIDITEAQKDKILGYIQEGAKVVKAEGDKNEFSGTTYNLKNMSTEAKKQVLDLAQKACAEVELTLTYSPTEDKIIIKDKAGVTAFENTPIVKTTGEDFAATSTIAIAVVSIAVLCGVTVLFAVSKKKGLLVK